jgi:hypothetical protein
VQLTDDLGMPLETCPVCSSPSLTREAVRDPSTGALTIIARCLLCDFVGDPNGRTSVPDLDAEAAG